MKSRLHGPGLRLKSSLGTIDRWNPPKNTAQSLTITFLGRAFGVILAYAVAFSVGYFTLYIAIAKNASAGAYAWRSIREYRDSEVCSEFVTRKRYSAPRSIDRPRCSGLVPGFA